MGWSRSAAEGEEVQACSRARVAFATDPFLRKFVGSHIPVGWSDGVGCSYS